MQRLQATFGLAIALLFGALLPDADAQNGKPKPLAPGVLQTINEDLEPRDMFTLPRPLPDLQATKYEPTTFPYKQTLHGQSGRVVLFRDNVWQYELSFLPLRQASLKVGTANGKIERKNVWYMMIRIRDTGKTMTFEQVKQHPDFDHVQYQLRRGKTVEAAKKKFLPRFTLEGSIPTADGYQKVAFRDVINPLLVAQIRAREDANIQLLDLHQLSRVKIPTAKNSSDPGVWAVAVWEEVDPRLDYVSVYVKGLTNAFRLGKNVNDPAKLKTLQINFWRPGDALAEDRDFIRYGIPLVDDPQKQVMICDRFDLPGPVIRGYIINDVAKREVLVVEADAKVSLKDFSSTLVPDLNRGKLPASIAEAFASAGITVNKGAAVTTKVEGQKWTFKQGDEEYILKLEPQFWEPDFGKIRFIRSLDHFWIYR